MLRREGEAAGDGALPYQANKRPIKEEGEGEGKGKGKEEREGGGGEVGGGKRW